MSIALDPISLVPGVGKTVSLPNPGNIQAVKFTNKSPYDAKFSGFGVLGTGWIASGTEIMLYSAIQNDGTINITLVNTANVTPANNGVVLLTEYEQGDDIPPGVWPISVPQQVVNNVTISTVSTPQTITPPAGTGTILVWQPFLSSSGLNLLIIQGTNVQNTSASTYNVVLTQKFTTCAMAMATHSHGVRFINSGLAQNVDNVSAIGSIAAPAPDMAVDTWCDILSAFDTLTFPASDGTSRSFMIIVFGI